MKKKNDYKLSTFILMMIFGVVFVAPAFGMASPYEYDDDDYYEYKYEKYDDDDRYEYRYKKYDDYDDDRYEHKRDDDDRYEYQYKRYDDDDKYEYRYKKYNDDHYKYGDDDRYEYEYKYKYQNDANKDQNSTTSKAQVNSSSKYYEKLKEEIRRLNELIAKLLSMLSI